MTKYYLEKCGYGKATYFKIVSCSESRAKKLKRDNYKIFNSRQDAEKYMKENR